MSWVAITLFTLREGRSIDAFRLHSLEFVRPEMMKMPSVLGFRDFAVTGTLDGSSTPWQAVEIIEVIDPTSFDADNRGEHGARITRDWLRWVDRFDVLFCHNLAAHTSTPAAEPSQPR